MVKSLLLAQVNVWSPPSCSVGSRSKMLLWLLFLLLVIMVCSLTQRSDVSVMTHTHTDTHTDNYGRLTSKPVSKLSDLL